MKLLYQTHSPYARKVLVMAHETGLQDRLTVIHHETSPTRRNEDVFALNPLGKVPVLICDDSTVLFDSNVICEYLDGMHANARVIPVEPRLRFKALKMQALAQGIADAGIAARWEAQRRPDHLRWPTMHDAQVQKIAAACDFLEGELGSRRGEDERDGFDSGGVGGGGINAAAIDLSPGIDIGEVALATALSWIEFRSVYAFLPGHPRLAAWYESLCARPSMLATALEGQTHD